jgi:phosphate transport system substrate-binding protein
VRLLLAVLVAWLPVDAVAATLAPSVFAGADPCLPIVRVLARSFRQERPDVRLDIPEAIGSHGALRALAEGEVTVALLAGPVDAVKAGRDVRVVPFARTALVVAVHPSVPETDITSPDLVRIYRGTKTRWRDGHEIVVLTRDHGDHTIVVFSRNVAGFREAYEAGRGSRRWQVLATDRQMHVALSHTAHGLGFSDAGSLFTEHVAVKPLALDGVTPTEENVAKGRYHLVETLAFAFYPRKLPATARAFVDFALSRAGQDVIRAHRYLLPE